MKNIRVHLLPEEIQIAEWVAQQRDATDRRMGIPNRLATLGNHVASAAHSVGAEIAVAHLLNAVPDFNTDPRRLKPWDLEWGGMTIDVKRTRTLFLNIPNSTREAMIYVAVTGEGMHYTVVGWITSDEAKRQEFWSDEAVIPCWKVPHERLHDLSGLWDRGQMQNVRPYWAQGS